MSLLSIRTESELLPLLYEGCHTKKILDKAEKLLGAPLRFTPGGDLRASIESESYPHDDLLAIHRVYEEEENPNTRLARKLALVRKISLEEPIITPPQEGRVRRIYGWAAVGNYSVGHVVIPETTMLLETIDIEQVKVICRYVALSWIVYHANEHGDSREQALIALLTGGSVANLAALLDGVWGELPVNGECYRLVCLQTPGAMSPIYLKQELKTVFANIWCVRMRQFVVAVFPADVVGLKAALESLAKTHKISACVSPEFTDIMECKKEFERIINLKPFLSAEPETVVQFDHYRERALFAMSGLGREITDLCCCDIVRGIRAYDAENNAKWFETLRAYIECDRVLAQTAAVLDVHINTVQYRLSKMQKQFNFDIARSDVLFRIMLSLRAIDETTEV